MINICLLAFSYPITASIPVLLGINSTPINIALRAIYVGLSIYLLLGAALQRESRAISVGGWMILIFWVVYSIRLFYDIQIREIYFSVYTNFKFYTLVYGSGFLTTLATIFTTRYVILEKAEKYFYYTILVSNICIISIVLFLYRTINPVQIAARVNFAVESSDGVRNSVINPITIAMYGELIGLFSLYILFFRKPEGLKKFGHWLGVILGIYVLTLAGSKGPLVAFFIICGYILMMSFYHSQKTKMFVLKLISFPIVIGIFVIQVVVPRIPWESLTIFRRMKSWLEDDYANSLDSRDLRYTFAWEEFLANPILGSRYLDQFNGYPHNIYLEALMALGILGGSTFFVVIFYNLYLVFFNSINNKGMIIFSVLVLAQLLIGMTSGSLFASYPMWIVISFYVSINSFQKNGIKEYYFNNPPKAL